jgi:hypothetical protein
MRACRRIRSAAPATSTLIINGSEKLNARLISSFPEKSPYPFNKVLGGHQSWPERFGEETVSSFAGNRTPDLPARNVITVPNKMHCLSFLHMPMLTYTTVCEEENL